MASIEERMAEERPEEMGELLIYLEQDELVLPVLRALSYEREGAPGTKLVNRVAMEYGGSIPEELPNVLRNLEDRGAAEEVGDRRYRLTELGHAALGAYERVVGRGEIPNDPGRAGERLRHVLEEE